jgi:plastocyanin
LRINKISVIGNYDKSKIGALFIYSISIFFALTFLYSLGNPFEIQYSNAQIHKPDTADIDATPISVVLMINEDKDGNVFFSPAEFSIRQGEEVLILNNATSNNHSFTNGKNPDDPMAGKLFHTDTIKSGSFAEYLAVNLSPGKYPFFSIANPSNIKGEMTILP